ncbi:MAG: DotI/IcmL/TraM family protein [Gammaproteobacteria bacterium]|nr:DotI/IcmL/TraM family protein [Gammaproteobacteria bacterium]
MLSERVENLILKDNPNLDHSQKIIVALIIAMILVLVAVSGILYQVFHRPLPQFRAVSANKQVMALSPYDEPNLLPATILIWASKAAVAAYTFDFVNYNKEIELAHPYFTDAGWTAYQAAIQRVITRVVSSQLFANGVVTGTPVISNQGQLPGHGYTWRVQVPFLVTFQSAEETKTDTYIVVMTIVKVPTSVNPEGIGIDQFQMI